MLQHPLFRSKWLAISYFLFINILFYLPGSALPKNNWMQQIHIDKWVHIGIFAVLIFLWRGAFNRKEPYYNGVLLFLVLLFGIMVEIIQFFWVPNRDFDLYDVAADMGGSFLGLFVWLRVYKKNKPL
jgi:VanZ family protein